MITVANGTELAYDDVGTGQAVLFLHAFPLDRSMWLPQVSALRAHCRCLVMDMRGFGDSSPGPEYSMDRYADDAVAVLDAANAQRAVVVGLSMGGYVALAMWRRHPQRIRALVLADTRAGADDAAGRERREELIALARNHGTSAVADAQVTGLLGRTSREKHHELVEQARRTMAAQSVEGVVGGLEAMMHRPDSTPTLATITVPTLVIVGDEDVLTPAKEARALHAGIAGSRLEIIGGAGHLSNLERPAAFVTLVAEFVVALETS